MPELSSIPIIRSKLYQPRNARGLIVRERLMKGPANLGGAVTLVSAPAGYGKTTFVSQLFGAPDQSIAWLSLDSADSDRRRFLAYLVAALRTAVSDCCSNTAEYLETSIVVSADEIAGVLCNDLELLSEPVVLVLDDYHQISGTDVHDLMNAIIKRPPRNLQIVISTRRDPPLSLQILRANGLLDEIRMQQLAFTVAESREFIRCNLGEAVSDQAIDLLQQRTEGWPVALRLAILAAPDMNSTESFAEGIPADIHAVREYLMQEVLATRTLEDRDYMLRAAFLDRFCAPLLEAVLPVPVYDSKQLSGREFLRRINEIGLFTIPLDNQDKWFRFHHLFQTMLKREAREVFGLEQTRDIHVSAARWFEDRGLLEEAIAQLANADMFVEAAALIVRHRNTIMNTEQWQRLDGWLGLLPSELIEKSPELLILRARIIRTRGGTEEAVVVLQKAKDLIDSTTINSELRKELSGSLESARCELLYEQSDGTGALAAARRALELVPDASRAERGIAHIIQATALQMTGEIKLAKKLLYAAMSDSAGANAESATFNSRLMVALGFVQWMDADLKALRPTANQGAELAASANLREALAVSRSFQAAVLYHQDELAAALDCLEDVTSSRSISNPRFHIQCLIISSLVYQEVGNVSQATTVAHSLREFALNTQSPFLIGLAEAFAAELALRQGRMTEALSWATQFDPEPLVPMYSFYEPVLTFVKILVLNDSDESRKPAGPVLHRLVDYLTTTHNNRFLIEALALRAMLLEACGETGAAMKDLIAAITLAQPGRFIRLFVDLGPRLGSLLNRLDLDDEGIRYIGAILSVFRKSHIEPVSAINVLSASSLEVGVEPLSKRELQILTQLADRLSNKEIADKLNISTVTVKRHAANIYQKLGVHGRRQAVAKAAGLGFFSHAQ